VSAARASIITEPEVAGAPDLVVEALSLGTVNRDRGYKRALYARSGVREYWIVDPKRKAIEIFHLGPTGFQAPVRYGPGEDLASAVIPELRIPLLEVFRK
jgi:Uma2 family endonuclease